MVLARTLRCNDATACNYTAYAAYCIQVEAYAEHDGMVGTKICRLHDLPDLQLCENEDDFTVRWLGMMNFQHLLYHDIVFPARRRWILGEGANPLVFPFIPEAEYDSWVTIGLDQSAVSTSGESSVSILRADPWVDPFESGGSLSIMDALGVWYILNGATNGIAGEDKKVLLGQFTTDGIERPAACSSSEMATASTVDSTN